MFCHTYHDMCFDDKVVVVGIIIKTIMSSSSSSSSSVLETKHVDVCRNIDHNWKLLVAQEDKEYLKHIPKQTYSRYLDGQPLTEWMIDNFENMLQTGTDIDWELAKFNRERREKVNLPETWNDGPSQ